MARRASFAFSTLGTLTVVAVVAVTGACSSLPDLHFDDGTEGGTGGEGGPFAEGGGPDGGTDAPVVPCVKSGAEICDDGLDNDCNGHTDCDDPACGAFACVAAPPDGWTLVGLAMTAPPACPTGFASADVRVLAGSDTTGCPCTCAGSGGTSCTTGTTDVTVGNDPTCNTGQTATVSSNTGATCTPLPGLDLSIGAVGSTGFGKLTPPAGPATCTPNASITKTDPTDGRTCTPAKVGAGCTGAMQCAPKAAGYTTCIQKTGTQVCPTGFANRRLAGTTSNDTRTCTACSCNTAPCSGGVTLWSNSMCNAKASKLTTAGNTTCAAPQAVSDTNNTGKYYTSNMAGGCAVGTVPTAQGALTFTDERTICCK